jgi:hypothetical protein
MIFTVMEVAKGMPNRLAWQGLRSCFLLSQRRRSSQHHFPLLFPFKYFMPIDDFSNGLLPSYLVHEFVLSA